MEIPIKKVYQELYRNEYRYILLWGGRGGGKSWAVANALITRAIKSPNHILCAREKQNSINESVYSLLVNILKDMVNKDLLRDTFFKLTKDNIIFNNGSKFIFKGLSNLTKDNIKSLEGTDICWVEEASSLTKDTIDTLLPTIRKENSQLIFTYNRNKFNDPIHTTFATCINENIYCRQINYYDNPYFPASLEQERLRCLNNEPDYIYRHIWLGEPYVEENVLITTNMLTKCKEFKSNTFENFIPILGVDVARSGNDSSVICVRQGNKVIETIKYKGLDGRELAEKILQVYNIYNNIPTNQGRVQIMIDSIGVGASPCDFLKSFGVKFIPVNFGANPEDLKYYNKRSECYNRLRDAMVDGLEFNSNCEDLITQLEYIPIDTSSERIKLIKKEDIKKKLGYSPDIADALALTYAYLTNSIKYSPQGLQIQKSIIKTNNGCFKSHKLW